MELITQTRRYCGQQLVRQMVKRSVFPASFKDDNARRNMLHILGNMGLDDLMRIQSWLPGIGLGLKGMWQRLLVRHSQEVKSSLGARGAGAPNWLWLGSSRYIGGLSPRELCLLQEGTLLLLDALKRRRNGSTPPPSSRPVSSGAPPGFVMMSKSTPAYAEEGSRTNGKKKRRNRKDKKKKVLLSVGFNVKHRG